MPKTIEEDEKGFVIIDGQKIEGWIQEDDDFRCHVCGSLSVYYDDYNAYFCPECNLWLTNNCGDPTCTYCRNRPEKPLPPVRNTRTWHDLIVALQHEHYKPIIVLLVGVFFLVIGAVELISSWSFVQNAASAEGTIVFQRSVLGWPEIVLGDGEPLNMATVEFRTADSGNVVRFEVGGDQLRVGQHISVLYNPANPNRAKIDEGGWLTMPLIFLGIGTIFVLWGLLWTKTL